MNSKEIRQQFIEFFVEKKAHTYAPASPVVPSDDPTLLFINAGMNQFKDVFLGIGSRPYQRAVNSQPCVRVSGKHNDLEEVGRDTTHLTLFEMLGNWSFGDYYKKEAITWAWELLTDVYKLPKDKLFATVFETDDESKALWQDETDIGPDRIVRCGKKDNFWEMGETGPCGPCSEIHIDLGPDCCDKKDEIHVCEVNGVCNRYVELWNLVFIQFDRKADGSLDDLPNKHVDTGLGLERLVGVIQKTNSNYQTDLFRPILAEIEKVSGIPYQDSLAGMPHRVLADHIRTLVFAIGDNVRPSNEGRGYVLRRLLRRALRYAKKLGVNEPILHKLVRPVIEEMGGFFENLVKLESSITSVILEEEKSFLVTLDSGTQLLDDLVERLRVEEKTVILGEDAFKLYDTFGFPVDLTEMMAEEKGFSVDLTGFSKCLEAQRERSRAAGHQGSGETEVVDFSVFLKDKGVSNDALHFSDYTDGIPRGGEARDLEDYRLRFAMARHHTGTHLLQAALRHALGDHVYQAGSLVDVNRLRFDFTHNKAVSKADLTAIEDEVNEKIEAALKIEIDKMSIDEAKALGAMALFGEKYDDIVRVVKIGDYSTELCGGTHLSNTKYIEKLKIVQETAVSSGVRRIEAIAGHYNIFLIQQDQLNELILKMTSRLNRVNEKALALKEKASIFNEKLELLGHLVEGSKGKLEKSADLQKKFEELLAGERDLGVTEKKIDKLVSQSKQQQAGQNFSEFKEEIELVPGTNHHVFAKSLDEFDMGMLRSLSDNVMNQGKSMIAILGGKSGGRGFALVKISQDLTSEFKAPDLLNQITAIAGGKGGGRPDMAQAGGVDPNKLEEAVQAVKSQILKATSQAT